MGNHLYHEAASRGNCAYIYIQSLPLPPFRRLPRPPFLD